MSPRALAILLLSLITLPAAAAAPLQGTPDPQTFENRWAGLVFDVFALDESNVWTVEDGGRIRHTCDGGATWEFMNVPLEVKDILRRVHVLSTGKDGWAVGENGWILYNDDSGLNNWVTRFQMPHAGGPEKEDMYDVFFADKLQGWVLGKHNIWYTVNGGANLTDWTPATLLDKNGDAVDLDKIELYAMDLWPGQCGHDCDCPGPPVCTCPLTPNFGLACAEPGFIYRTLDGITWKEVFDVRELCPTQPNCSVGDGFLASCSEKDLCDYVGMQNNPPICTLNPDKKGDFEPWDIEISRNQNPPLAIMVGGSVVDCGMAFVSDDWGCSWQEEQHECEFSSTGVCQLPPECQEADIKDRKDPLPLDFFRTLYGVGIFDGGPPGNKNSAIAAGYHGQHVRRPGGPPGQVWCDYSLIADPFEPDTTAVIFPMFGAEALTSATPKKGWIVGSYGHIRRTKNGGKTYEDQASEWSDFRIQDVHFTTELDGWFSGQFFNLAQTINRGVDFVPEQHEFFELYLNAVVFSNMNRGVAVGDFDQVDTITRGPKIFWTDNNGDTDWQLPTSITYDPGESGHYDSKSLREVDWDGASTQTFWAVGQDGLILQTTDGGDKWNQLVIPNSAAVPMLPHHHSFEIHGVAFTSATAGFVVGERQDLSLGAAFLYQAGTWIDVSPTDNDIKIITDVDVLVGTSVAYAVGRKQTGGTKEGVILKWNGTKFEEVSSPPPPFIPECSIGANATKFEPLNEVAVLSGTNVFVGGQCGRVWHYNGVAWTEQKSQTSIHIQGMSFVSQDLGYMAARRQGISSIVRYDNQ